MYPEFEQILAESIPEVEKLARCFLAILNHYDAHSKNEIELHKAMGDEHAQLKEQIKRETLKHSGEILAFCYFRVTGRKLTDV